MGRPRKQPVVDRVVVYQQNGEWSFVAYAGERFEIAEDWFRNKMFVLKLMRDMFPDALVEQASLEWEVPLPPAVESPSPVVASGPSETKPLSHETVVLLEEAGSHESARIAAALIHEDGSEEPPTPPVVKPPRREMRGV